jgi:dCTP diphosphatase
MSKTSRPRQNAKTMQRPRPTPPADPPHDNAITLGHLKEIMRHFVRQRAWEKYHTPRNLAASIAVEAGELLELFQWLTPAQARRRCREDAAFRKALGEEMCDVMMYLIGLANVANLDLSQAIFAKMDKNRTKYPAEHYHGWYERPLPS